jgi:hypothetical protein
MALSCRTRPALASGAAGARRAIFARASSTRGGAAGAQPPKLNAVSATITAPKSQGASQAMLYATGLKPEDMAKAQIGEWRRMGGGADAVQDMASPPRPRPRSTHVNAAPALWSCH